MAWKRTRSVSSVFSYAFYRPLWSLCMTGVNQIGSDSQSESQSESFQVNSAQVSGSPYDQSLIPPLSWIYRANLQCLNSDTASSQLDTFTQYQQISTSHRQSFATGHPARIKNQYLDTWTYSQPPPWRDPPKVVIEDREQAIETCAQIEARQELTLYIDGSRYRGYIRIAVIISKENRTWKKIY